MSREHRRSRLEIAVVYLAGIHEVCVRFHHRDERERGDSRGIDQVASRIDQSSPWTARTYLEGRVLCGDLREADYVAEVDSHRLVIFSWYLMHENIYIF